MEEFVDSIFTPHANPSSFDTPRENKISEKGSSIFNETGEMVLTADHQKNKFEKFINNRIEYLGRLHSLPDNWMNGETVKPGIQTITNAIFFLLIMKNYLLDSENYSNIKMLVSPTPAGNITFQLSLRRNFLISEVNHTHVEFELSQDSKFLDLPSASVTEENKIKANLEYLFNG
jgi:hypothetical protein